MLNSEHIWKNQPMELLDVDFMYSRFPSLSCDTLGVQEIRHCNTPLYSTSAACVPSLEEPSRSYVTWRVAELCSTHLVLLSNLAWGGLQVDMVHMLGFEPQSSLLLSSPASILIIIILS